MNDDNVTQLSPAEEDPLVHEWFRSLASLEPSAGFENAVMARVWRPAPRWLQSVHNATRAWFSGKRMWGWAGGLATCSAASLAVLAWFTASHWVQVETTLSLFTASVFAQALSAAADAGTQVVGATLAVRAFLGVPGIILATLVATFVPLLSAWGLYNITKNFNPKECA